MPYIYYPPHLPPPTAPKLVQGIDNPPFDNRKNSHLISILSWQPLTIVEVPLLPTVDVVGFIGARPRLREIYISWLPPEPFPFIYLKRGPFTEGAVAPAYVPFYQYHRQVINNIWDISRAVITYENVLSQIQQVDNPPFTQRRDVPQTWWDTQFPSQFTRVKLTPAVAAAVADNPPFRSNIQLPILYDLWNPIVEQWRALSSISQVDNPPFGQRGALTEQLSWYVDLQYSVKRVFVPQPGVVIVDKIPFHRLQLPDIYQWWDVFTAQQHYNKFTESGVDNPPFNPVFKQHLAHIVQSWTVDTYFRQRLPVYIPPVVFPVNNPPFGFTRRQLFHAEFWDNWTWYIHEYRRLGGVRIPSRGPWIPIDPGAGGPWVPTAPSGGGPWTPIIPDAVPDVWTPIVPGS